MNDDQNTQPEIDDERTAARKKQADSNDIDELRERLYARDASFTQSTRHTLSRQQRHDVAPTHHTPQQMQKSEENVAKEGASTVVAHEVEGGPTETTASPIVAGAVQYDEGMTSKKKSGFRKWIVIFGVLFFIVAVGLSLMSMFWGNNNISGDNISIKTSGPVSVGGGDEFSFQVSIANQNTVPIKAAVLIIEYPSGVQSTHEQGKEMSIERMQLDAIDSGELINIPVSVLVYGEEDEEKEIQVRIEYRVEGSNAIFEKEATSLRFKISTSPVVMEINTLDNVSSGQEFEIKVVVQSNSPTPLSDILVKAVYPTGFEFIRVEPDTVSGSDTWQFETLEPNERQTIVITGMVIGGENEVLDFYATTGVAGERDKYELMSQLANAHADLRIEQPFLDINMSINKNNEEVVVVSESTNTFIDITYKNSLETALYDGEVVVSLGGNALDEYAVRDLTGYYDSNKNTITWDSTDEPRLDEVLPGESVQLNFMLDPKKDVGTAPGLTLETTVRGSRSVFSDSSAQELVGIVARTIKVESEPELIAATLYKDGPFTNSGPTPPVAEEVTQYTYALKVESGANDLTNTTVKAVVPRGVSWLDLTSSDDVVTYNSSTRELTWTIGSMESRSTKEMYAQVSFQPSLSQIGTTPTILQSQRLEAVDRFTGTTVRDSNSALTTRLAEESDNDILEGKVQDPNE